MIPRLKRQTKKRHTWSRRRARTHARRSALIALVDYANRSMRALSQPIIGAKYTPDVWAP